MSTSHSRTASSRFSPHPPTSSSSTAHAGPSGAPAAASASWTTTETDGLTLSRKAAAGRAAGDEAKERGDAEARQRRLEARDERWEVLAGGEAGGEWQ